MMKKKVFFGITIALVFLSLATGIGFSQAARAGQIEAVGSVPASATAPWEVGWVDKSSSTAIGTYPRSPSIPLTVCPTSVITMQPMAI
jgi:hypothetical protein